MKKLTAVLTGKLINSITRATKRGGGSAAPGLYASQIDPGLLRHLAKQIPENIVITGTNGKTTTAKLLTELIESQGQNVLRNSTGSNLKRGVLSALLQASTWTGSIKKVDVGLWELDEAAFNTVVFDLKPQVIVFLNVFRDQLDRYGEVDNVVRKWQETLSKIDWSPLIIVNANDGHTLELVRELKLANMGFKVEGAFLKWEKAPVDVKAKELITAKVTKNLGMQGTQLVLNIGNKPLKITLPIPGIYHIFDFLAAFCVYYSLNMPFEAIQPVLDQFSPAFGRVEKFSYKRKEAYIFLIKNPAGATAVFETIAPSLNSQDTVLLALNDNFADGTDISWIWDADFNQLQPPKYKLNIIVSGKRANDLALRVKYSDLSYKLLAVKPDLAAAFDLAWKQTRKGGRIFLLPTYTALLELQGIMAKRKIKQEYWKE